jgi:bifunctional UDP-N-acetylglucosamine pyrophosphorylase/glucosamine-1-phosphate N-acetyltransferase
VIVLKAIILSAGEGTRMRPLTLTKPKTMLPVAGKPIIQYNIEALRDNGISDILLIVGYKENIIKDYFGDGHEFGVNISYKKQKKLMGTANAVGYGKEFIGNDNFIVLNGDIILDSNLIAEIITDFNKPLNSNHNSFNNSSIDTLIVLTEVNDPSPFGVVDLKNNLVKKIVEKPKKEEAPSNLINTGIYVFNNDIFNKIAKTKVSSRGEYEITDSLTLQIEDKKIVKGFITNKQWIDVGRPWELLEINETLLKNIKLNIKGKVEDGARIHGNIFLDEGSVIRSGVYIEGSVYIGKNCDIGPNCYIRGNSYFGDNVKVGNAVEVKNSIVMENTNINHLSYVGDSVIGSKCNLGAGTNIANLRFDDKPVKIKIKGQKTDSGRRKLGSIIGDNVKTGVNSSFSPGVTVGFNSFIGPEVLLQDDVESNKIVLLKQQHHEIENINKDKF